MLINRLKTLVTLVAGFTLLTISGINNSWAAFSYDPDLNWRTIHTAHFDIHYHDGEQAIADKVAGIAERAHQRVTRFFNWVPQQATQLVLLDRMDFSNAYAVPVPRNTMYIIITPPDDVDVIPDFDDWLDLVINHEYTHIVHIDKVLGIPQKGRNIFGRMILFFPNVLQPLWVLEGIATYIETQTQPGFGRGDNTAFRSLMRLEVDSGIKPLDQVNLPITSWPAGTTRYLYGVYFFNFLRDQYGEAKLKQWIEEYSDNLIPFSMDSNTRLVFGKSMSTLWYEFSNYLQQHFNPQIQQIKAAGIVAGTQQTHDGYFTGYPRSTANGDILYFKQDFASRSMLMLLPNDGSTPRAIAEVYSGRFDVHPSAGVLLAQIDLYRNVNYFSDLYHIDIQSGTVTQLTHGQRYQHATWSADGTHIYAVHNQQGQTALHLLDASGKFEKELWRGVNNEVISQIDSSPDGKTLIAAMWRAGSHWNLELFNLETSSWQALTHSSAIELQPQFTTSGKAIVYSADYNGVPNIYRFDLETQKITQLTNVMGGALSATLTPDESTIYYMGQNRSGTDIYRLAVKDTAQQPVTGDAIPVHYPPTSPVATVAASDTSTAVTTSANTAQHDTSTVYSALDKIAPTTWFPYLQIDKDRSEVGIVTAGSDPLFWHSYSTVLAYDTRHRWLTGYLDYQYDRWSTALKLYLERSIVTVRDSADDVNSYRNDDTAIIEAILPHFKRDQQWSIHAGISANTQSDKELASGGIALPSYKDELVGVALTYNSAKSYPRGISEQDGYRWRLVAEDSDRLDSDYTGQVYTLDWRGYFTLSKQHILAARLVAGKGTQSPNPFRLGGVRNGYYVAPPNATLLEPTTEVFNKREYALRGYPTGLNELIGRRMNLAELEWRFPIALVETGIMAPPVGLQQLHGKLFYNTGDAWDDNVESAHYLAGAGLELTAEIIVGYFIPLDLRLGLAHGFDKLGEDQAYAELGVTF